MLTRLALAVLLAGVLAGLAASLFQAARVVPLIHAAERYESGAPDAGAAGGHAHDAAAAGEHAQHGEVAPVAEADWQPGSAVTRSALTVLANVAVSIGYAMLLCAGALATGLPTGWRAGLVWGAAGFFAFVLSPALGLPPLLPGMAGGDIAARQLWWLVAAGGAAAGLMLFATRRDRLSIALGLALVILPHLWGAPQPATVESAVPAHLAAQFALAAIGTALLHWLTLGALTGAAVEWGLRGAPEAGDA